MDNKLNNARIYEYDLFRILVTLFVVMGHINVTGLIDRDLGSAGNLFVFNQGYFLDWIYSFHMPAFAFLSGAVFNESKFHSFDYLITNKFKRLILPYFVIGLLIIFPLKLCFGFYSPNNILALFNTFVMGAGEYEHLWFLLALFWCFVVFYFPCKHIFKRSVLGGGCVIYLITRYIVKVDFDLYLFRTGMTYLMPFAAGYIFNHYYMGGQILSEKVTITYMIVYAVLMISNFLYGKNLNLYFLHYTGIGFVLCLIHQLLRWFPCIVGKHKSKLLFISSQTFSIYLLHVPILSIFTTFLQPKIQTSAELFLYLFICIITLLIGPMILNLGAHKFLKHKT